MPYCDRCGTLTARELRENDLLLHPNLKCLKDRADGGCELCFVFWTAFKRDAAKYVDRLLRGESPFPQGSEWSPGIWLNGNQFGHPTSGDTVAVSCGRRGPKSSFWEHVNPEPIEAVLEVYEGPGPPSKYNIRGRRSTAYQDPGLHVVLIRQWMAACRAHHPRCSLALGKGCEMPTRVMHVGDPVTDRKPRLVSAAEDGICEPYLALSYCWGASTAGFAKLTDATYSSFVLGIDESDLSKSHQEMMSLARALGVQYVWIDALCIIQSNTADWERESRRMAIVYGNAALTVIAGRSSDSGHGFIANDSDYLGTFCELPKESSEKSTIMVGLKRSPDIGPTSTRAWCFQERLLSQRAVVFGTDQLKFSCRAGTVYEDGFKSAEYAGSRLLASTPTRPHMRDEQQVMMHETLKEWYGLLFPYTRCKLSNPHDVFASLAAIAQHVAKVLGSRYLAGIWECDIVRGLMWRPTYHLAPNWEQTVRPKPTSLTGSGTTRDVVCAPSWSWASVQGQVLQQSFSPPNVELYRDASNFNIRPRPSHPDRWSEGSECGADKLHMPVCELRFMGRVVEARILDESPKLRYTRLRQSAKRPVKGLAHSRYSVLLVDVGAPRRELDSDELLDNVTALGHVDVQEERVGVSTIYCLLVVSRYGLMLKSHNANGSYSRLGWFMLEQDQWFRGQVEIDIALG
ncbi:Heterokaryon incompatibility [Metarhizium album ARSEF 1941]|uniref:Heterokaryon incompatibility n=1 Tax=Metarhizium album (strain ARSEF 1941) TaxID=1081103 RepID=A0A0B2WM42_METAS|nr:Heterokaryon incompatibility [Metarhizium album ARSEF 1941]KHN94085.1 Heterokaryon incompatibility [Metarhizium album ARSEF 1941]